MPGSQTDETPNLTIPPIICPSCCFWLRSPIIWNKLTWNYNPHAPLCRPAPSHPRFYNYTPVPLALPTAYASYCPPPLPSCIRPFSVTILYFDGSWRKGRRGQRNIKTGVTLTFRHGARLLRPPPPLSSTLYTLSFYLFVLLTLFHTSLRQMERFTHPRGKGRTTEQNKTKYLQTFCLLHLVWTNQIRFFFPAS